MQVALDDNSDYDMSDQNVNCAGRVANLNIKN